MEILGNAKLPFPREQVWKSLNDPVVIRHAVPGCESMTAVSAEKFVATVVAKVGPIKAKFDGYAIISDAVRPVGYTLTATGKGGLSGFASAVIKVRLHESSATTHLDYSVEANLGGKLAQLGTRLIESAARNWAEEFFRRFALIVQNGGAPPQAIELAPTAKPGLWRRFVSSVARLFGSDKIKRIEADDRRPVEASVSAKAMSVQMPSQPDSAIPPDISTSNARVMATGYIDVDIGNQVAEIVLNRPEVKNCVSLGMWQELSQIFNDLSGDKAVRCVVLRGAGGNFTSGADISEFGEVRATPEQVDAYEVAVDAACDAILECRKPVIAAIEGYCVGGGLGLAMACDFRVAAQGSQLFIPAARMSIVYGLRETQTLLALVGLTQAKRILYTGERVSAEEAKAIGLVDCLADKDNYQEELATLVNKLKSAAPLTVSGSKAILNSLGIVATPEAARQAGQLIKAAGASHDYHEGRRAFAEKRAPEFKGY